MLSHLYNGYPEVIAEIEYKVVLDHYHIMENSRKHGECLLFRYNPSSNFFPMNLVQGRQILQDLTMWIRLIMILLFLATYVHHHTHTLNHPVSMHHRWGRHGTPRIEPWPMHSA